MVALSLCPSQALASSRSTLQQGSLNHPIIKPSPSLRGTQKHTHMHTRARSMEVAPVADDVAVAVPGRRGAQQVGGGRRGRALAARARHTEGQRDRRQVGHLLPRAQQRGPRVVRPAPPLVVGGGDGRGVFAGGDSGGGVVRVVVDVVIGIVAAVADGGRSAAGSGRLEPAVGGEVEDLQLLLERGQLLLQRGDYGGGPART